ncbi:glutathione S-transferase [Mycena galopus ATCC 62051]|nr:glutathione S-transferase [Mycena galopus ATCC 62051]
MVLKLYAAPYLAGGGAIVALALWEKQVPFEFFLAMHPFGQVPVIASDDDGFIVYESRAIWMNLLPKGLKERSVVEQLATVESATFHPAVAAVAKEALWKKRQGLAVDQAVLDQALVEFKEKLAVYDVILSKSKFLAGDEFTLADLCHYSYAPLLADGGIDVMTTQGPNVARWWNELMSRSTWVKAKAEGLQSKSSY